MVDSTKLNENLVNMSPKFNLFGIRMFFFISLSLISTVTFLAALGVSSPVSEYVIGANLPS